MGFVFVQSESNKELRFSKIIALLIEGYSTSEQKNTTPMYVYTKYLAFYHGTTQQLQVSPNSKDYSSCCIIAP